VENGICIRLYSEEAYRQRPLFTPPEVLRTNLSEVILRMMALKLGHPLDFPFIDKPATKAVSDGFDLLSELGAIEAISNKKKKTQFDQYTLTQKGRLMARLPIDPRLSRMIIANAFGGKGNRVHKRNNCPCLGAQRSRSLATTG